MEEAIYERITRDNPHVEVQRLVSKPIDQRLFGNWAMRDDPARSWMWTQEEVKNGAISRATEDAIVGVFERLAGEESEVGGVKTA